MNPIHRLPMLLATAVSGFVLPAQGPVNPPPWWGVADDVTVSLYWNFAGPTPLVPQAVAVPAWYNPAVTQAVPTGPLVLLPNLAGKSNVLALVGNGTTRTARLDVTVDNDPHIDWVKIFWFQFDEFEGASGSLVEAIQEDLAQYKRSSMTTTREPIGNGWFRVTVTATLIPQPDDEEVDFTFTEQAFGTVAVDNLYVNSKCVKLDESDQDGDALGMVDGFTIDLTAATNSSECLAAAVTVGPSPSFLRTYWVSSLGTLPGAPHQIFRLNQSGVPIAVTPLPDTLATAPFGPSDLAVETLPGPAGTQTQYVYALVDLRTTATAHVLLRAIDTNGTLVTARNVPLVGFPSVSVVPPQRFGLAFNPSGNLGLGSFWVTAPGAGTPSLAYEFDRSGGLLRTLPGLPPGTVGAGYDSVYGNLYFFSNDVVATPTGPVRVNGSEWSAYDHQPTGVTFHGNLQLPNPGGPRGGIASGFETYRRANGQFRAVCVAQVGTRSVLYELKGPFRWGASLLGTCGMQGLPFEGSTNLQFTLSGVPNATFAALYIGFQPLNAPFSLAPFGLPETNVLVNLHMNSALLPPAAPGRFVFPFPVLPPGFGFSYAPFYFQWLVFDPSAPNGISMSPGGKTLLY
ncbi:MAG: hypothetical protein FJ265_07275 [Planctomycetes bacterium]|nr:hypothetical protein [Planctomycetota bacterium]